MFSSGMDTADLGALAADPSQLHAWRASILAIWNLCEDMAKPTIAQIHGACLGGAAELALACDLRVMAAEAVIGLVETRVGLIPDVGGCSRLPALVGLGRAKELILASKVVDGTEAERIGLVNRVAPAAGLDAATEALVAELLACAPLAVGLAKGVLNAAARPALASTLEQEVAAQEACAESADFREGTLAFAERRTPRFTGS
jgi:enoyl-CoA hydratase/carnithine racemase